MKKSKATPGPIKKIGRIRDKRDESYLEIIDFPISETERSQYPWPPSVINEPRTFEKHLRDKGALLPKEDLRECLKKVALQDAKREFVYEARTGWNSDRTIFVFPDSAIGPNTKSVRGINRDATDLAEGGQLALKGTLNGWTASVAENVAYSSLLMLGACTAFAGPLLFPSNEASFSLCIFGPSRTGKTVATLVAASIIGAARPEDLINWRITEMKLDQRLSEYNDSVFPIDDFETLDDDGTKYSRLRALAYRISQGAGKARSKVYTQTHRLANARWRCIAVTSSESSIAQIAREAGRQRQHGEALRLVDIPALVDDEPHIFDRPPANTVSSTLWRADQITSIFTGCAANHGQAFREYIRFLLARRNLDIDIKTHRNTFMGVVADSGDDERTRDLARKFGLLYAGGCLAKQAGIVNWDIPAIQSAVAKYYSAARKLLPNQGETLKRGVELLRNGLHALPMLPIDAELDRIAKICGDADGFRRRVWGKTFALLKREAFDALFETRPQRLAVEAWLIEKGSILLAKPKKAGAGGPHPKNQHKWPDDQRRRSYRINLQGDLALNAKSPSA